MSNFYEVLGVEKNATPAEIRNSYRKKLLEFHPDKSKQNSTVDRLKEVQKAFGILGDETRKNFYDQWLKEQNLRSFCSNIFDTISFQVFSQSENSFPCRCGGEFLLSESERELFVRECLIPCSNCSLLLKIVLE